MLGFIGFVDQLSHERQEDPMDKSLYVSTRLDLQLLHDRSPPFIREVRHKDLKRSIVFVLALRNVVFVLLGEELEDLQKGVTVPCYVSKESRPTVYGRSIQSVSIRDSCFS